MDYKTYIGNHPQKVFFVHFIVLYRIVIVGGKQYLRPGAFPVFLLLLVQCLFQKFCTLPEYEPVKFGKVSGIITYGIFNQKDSLHTDFEDVVLCIEHVLEQLDYGDDKVRISVPAEY